MSIDSMSGTAPNPVYGGYDQSYTSWLTGYAPGSGWNSTGYALPWNNAKASEAIRSDLRTYAMQLQAQGFNSAEAQKTRDWEKMMSDTAFQRKAADLQAAGFSPLAALSGASGASTPSVSSASSGHGQGHGSNPDDGGLMKMLGMLVSAVVSKGMSSAMVAQEMQSKAQSAMDVAQAKIASSEKIAAAKLGKALGDDVGKVAKQSLEKAVEKTRHSADGRDLEYEELMRFFKD